MRQFKRNRLNEAVLTCTHNIFFEQKYDTVKKKSTENSHFYSCEKLLYIAWACFRNDRENKILMVHETLVTKNESLDDRMQLNLLE